MYNFSGAVNLSTSTQVTSGSTSFSGVNCIGSETNFSQCAPAPATNFSKDGFSTICRLTIQIRCFITDAGANTTTSVGTPSTTTSAPTSLPTNSPSHTEVQTLTNRDGTASPIPSGSGSKDSNSLLKAPNLYYFIVGVAAVILAGMLLVLVLTICCCCGRKRMKGISPYDIEKQNGLTDEKDGTLRLEVPSKEPTNGMMIHHQLQQSGPIYEAIQSNENSSTHSQESPSSRSGLNTKSVPPLPPSHPPQNRELYSVLKSTDTYAQLEVHIPPDILPRAEPSNSNSDYQLLNHKTSSLKRDRAPPVQAVNRTALAVAQGLLDEGDLHGQENRVAAGTSFSLPREASLSCHRPPLPRNGSLKRPHLEEVQLRSTDDCGSSSDHNTDQENTNFYHIIEPPPPNYASLEGLDEGSDVSCNNGVVRNRHANSTGSSSPQLVHQSPSISEHLPSSSRPRISSKSSVSTVPSLHSSSHSSLTSSLSSNSPQISRSVNNSSPLVGRVNAGPRVTNKYTESPVLSRKDQSIGSPMTARSSKLSGQSDNADVQSNHSDGSVRNTLV